MKRFLAVLVLDDGMYVVYSDGTLERVEPGMHPRPGGLSTAPLATRRRR